MSADFWLTDLLISIRLRCVGQTRRLTYCIADDVMSTDFWLLTTGTEKHDLRNKVSWFQIKKGSQVCRGDVRFFLFDWLFFSEVILSTYYGKTRIGKKCNLQSEMFFAVWNFLLLWHDLRNRVSWFHLNGSLVST